MTNRFFKYFIYYIVITIFSAIHAESPDVNGRFKTIRVAIDKEYAPYEFIDLDGEIKGFTPDLLREMGKSLHIHFSFFPMEWPEAVAALDEGEIDLINMIKTSERNEMYEFSQPHSYIKQAIFRHISTSGITDLDSLSGYKIALQYNDISLEMLATRSDFQRLVVRSKAEGFLLLNAGKADAFLAADQAGLRLIREYKLSNVVPAAMGLFPREFCFAARKGNQELITLLNTGLKQVKKTNRYDEIVSEWLAIGIPEHTWFTDHWRIVTGLIIALATFLLVFVIWTFMLRRAVETRTKALHESRNFLNEAQQIARTGSWDWDIPQNILHWSDETFRIFGINQKKFSADFGAFIKLVHSDDRQRVEKSIEEAVQNGSMNWSIDYRIVRPDGELRYLHEQARSICLPDGRVIKRLGTVQDITEQKQREDELQRYRNHLEEEVQQRTEELSLARDAAQAANKAKSVFLANMSHELRTPLNAILGFSQIMHKDPGLSPAQRGNLEIINNSGEHLLKLINDVLEIAKIEAGKMQLEISSFDLHALVREVSDMMRLRAQQKELQLELDQSSMFPHYIKGDEARLRQILVNLISNAVKFTESGGVTIRLSVIDNVRNHLLIEIEDTGPGISEIDQKLLFKPFVQLTHGTNEGGTGLGLAIAHEFVMLMDGRIRLASTPGKGSLFSVELPFEEANEADLIHLIEDTHREIINLEPGQPVYRILVAEDQKNNQLLLVKLMTDIGMETRTANDGKECVHLFKEWKPDLIFMDRRMPVLNGEEATRKIRDLPDGRQVKIIAVTASAFKEEYNKMIAAGMNDVIRKPYRINEIYHAMTRQLGLRFIYGKADTDLIIPKPDVKKISALPEALCTELREALESLDPANISAAIQHIAEKDIELSKILSKIVESLNYPVILKALENSKMDRPDGT